jgi:hypothetical protein
MKNNLRGVIFIQLRIKFIYYLKQKIRKETSIIYNNIQSIMYNHSYDYYDYINYRLNLQNHIYI